MVIDAFFVRAADDFVRHHDRFSTGRRDEREHFFGNVGIVADIDSLREPAPKFRSVGMLGRHDAGREVGCRAIVRAVERDGS